MNQPAGTGQEKSRKLVFRQLMHLGRVAIVVALLLSIPKPHQRRIDSSAELAKLAEASGADPGNVIRTLPEAADVIGYRGPTEAMIVLGDDLKIEKVDLLSSADTVEHVDAVRRDKKFFEQFRGWPWGGPPANLGIDGVSGATLTSLALAQGVIRRIGGDRPSLVFPNELSEAEADSIRTGPYSDTIIGYQGPTELLLKLDSDQRIAQVAIRSSYDNQPYVDYVRQERGFWKLFVGRTLDELAEMDPQAERVEGVSGATMTSLAVADTLVAAAGQYNKSHDESQRASASNGLLNVRWTRSDIATVSILILALLLRRLGAFRSAITRRVWLLLVLGVIGFWSGNLISMALVVGWSSEGIAWRLAPGLAAIAAVTFLIPPLTKANPYCNHLCPHGAIQQLIKPTRRSRRHMRLSAIATKWLTRIPGFTLIMAYLTLLAIPTVELASWEPFHAYLFRIASWGAIGLAIGSLVVSSLIPMGYCRMGCPTGRLIEHVRLDATSGRFKRADVIALLLLVAAWMTRVFSTNV